MTRPLDEQVILVTGASSGIGRCAAELLAERGARVVLVSRRGEALAALGADDRRRRLARPPAPPLTGTRRRSAKPATIGHTQMDRASTVGALRPTEASAR